MDLEYRFRDDIDVELVKMSASDADVIWAAKVSTAGVRVLEHVDVSNPDRFIEFLMRGRHGSPFEHTSFTFFVSAPIFMWREHFRHRIASYNEESGRYKQLEPVFYIPSLERNLVQVGKPGEYRYVPGSPELHATTSKLLMESCSCAYSRYQDLLDEGVAREVARMALPLNIFSSAYVTMNARALMNFLSLRRYAEESMFPSFPMREIEMVAEEYEKVFAAAMPITHAAFVNNGRVAP